MRWLIILTLLLPFVSAYNISVAYPEEANFNESFDFNLTLIDFSGVYDIKIDIQNNSAGISEMNNSGVWRSTNRYFIRAINTTEKNFSIFQLRISERYVGFGNITIRVRNSDSTSWYRSFSNYSIYVNNSDVHFENPVIEDTAPISEPSPFIILEAGKELENGKEFEVKCKYGNIDDGDVKVYIEIDGDVVSEIYDASDKKWKSGIYYVGMDEEYNIRIKKNFRDVEGSAELVARLREGDKVVDEERQNIKILPEEEEGQVNGSESIVITEESSEITANKPVVLNAPQGEERVIYESRNEIVRKNLVYVFCVFLIVLLAFVLLKR
jgi:hypothetical protein